MNLKSDQDSLSNLIMYATLQGRMVHLRRAQDPNASGSQQADLPYQQSTPLDSSSSKQDQEIQDLCREILMVRIATTRHIKGFHNPNKYLTLHKHPTFVQSTSDSHANSNTRKA